MKRLALAIMIAWASSGAMALDLPKGSTFDSRIQHVAYNEEDVVEINGYPGIATQITFADGEEVLDIASGFSQGWEFANRRNNLYLKPKSVKLADNTILEPEAGKWDTNLIITTSQRTYAFHLVLHKGRDDKKLGYNPKIAFRIAFTYPADEAAKAKAAADKRTAQERLENQPAPRNWSYSMQIGEGSDGIAPTMAYDDGRFTYLRFPGNREFPAVFMATDAKDKDGEKGETLVNTHIDPKSPDVLVVHRVGKEMHLRLGNAVVGVFNDAFDAFGVPPKGGTTVPGVKRTTKGQAPILDDDTTIYMPVTGAASAGRMTGNVVSDPRAPYLPAGWNANGMTQDNREDQQK